MIPRHFLIRFAVSVVAALIAALGWPAAAAAQLVVAPATGGNPQVFVIDGGAVTQTIQAFDPLFRGGVHVALGDINGDGTLDIITGAGPGGGPHVKVFSGTDLSELYSFYAYNPAFIGGVTVAAGDVDGDGRADIITGAGPLGGPHVRVLSGVDLRELASFYAYDPAFTGGVYVAAGDVNGDGLSEIITGAGPGGAPLVRVITGTTTPIELASFNAYNPAFAGGVRVAAGDVNGDGLSDIVTAPGPTGAPLVRVITGTTTLTELASFYAFDPAFAGGVSVATGDTNADGRVDLILGAGPGGGSHVRVVSGLDLSELQSFTAPTTGAGVSVGSMGDAGARFTSPTSTILSVGTSGLFTVTTAGFRANLVPAITISGTLPFGVGFVDQGDGTATLFGAPNAGTAGDYPLTFTATNGWGALTTQTFTLTVREGTAITSANATRFEPGVAGSFTVTTTGSPLPVISASGTLPAGVTFVDNGNGTATLAGTPAAGTDGTYPLTITADNGVGAPATQAFTLTVGTPQAPAITSASATAFTVGAAGSFTVATTGVPTPTLTVGGVSLPAGVTFVDNGNGTGTLGGTPAAGTGGTYAITFTAANGIGAPAVQNFTLTVNQGPAVTSANTATFAVGSAGSFTVTTSGFPTPALAQSGALPTGVTFTDNGDGTGTLSGTPAADTGGTYPLTLTATNSTGSATQSFTLTVHQAPMFTSAATATFTAGIQNSFVVRTTGFPPPTITIVATLLPEGVTFVDNGDGTGTLSGNPPPAAGGIYNLPFIATNGVGFPASQPFALTVNSAPTFTSANTTAFTVGNFGTFAVTTVGTPTPAVTVTGALPSGVSFVANFFGGGTLSGMPGAGTSGTYPLTFTATNSAGTATQSFTLIVIQPPAITSANNTTFRVGAAGSFTVTTSGFPPPSIVRGGASLPGGVNFLDNGNGTGTLSGTPAAGTAGTYAITFTASNGGGSVTQPFTLIVGDGPAIDLDLDDDGGTPPVTGTGYAITFTEGSAPQFIEDEVDATITDVDSPTLTSITVTITNVLDATQEKLDVDLVTGGFNANFTKAFDDTTTPGVAVLTITATTPQPIADFNTLLRRVTYQNIDTTGANATAPRTITFVVNDGVGNSNTATTTVTITATDDPPTADNDSYTVAEGGTLTIAAPGVLDGDLDPEGDPLTAVLVASPANASAFTLNADGSFTYTHDGSATTTDSFTYQASANGLLSNIATVTITITNVNDAPTAVDDTNTTTEDAPVSAAAPGVLANDTDPDPGDTKTVSTVNGVAGNVGVPTATAKGASVTLNANGSYTYNPGAVFQSLGAGQTDTDTFTYTMQDAAAAQSNTATVTITITGVNDAPVVTAGGGSAAFTEDGPAVAVAPALTVTDAEAANLASATVQILPPNYVNGQDVLEFTNQAGITGVFAAATGTLTLTGSATAAAYQTALQSVTYNNTSQNPSTLVRTVQFQVNDGTVNSNTSTRTVSVAAVNDAPVITAGGTLNFTEGNPATAIDTTIVVTDPDDTNLESATVQILPPNYVNGQDILALPVTAGITGVFTPATGTLTLTGSATVAAYQAALRTVTYFNNSATPSVVARSVNWVVNDGTASSNTAASTITVTAVNSAPSGGVDAWTTFGNTELVVDQAGPSTPRVADTTPSTFGVLDNDTDVEGDPRIVSGIVGCADTAAPFTCATTGGGSVTMESNGRLTYRPQGGDTGSDSFQYILTDIPSAGTPANVNVTVNLTLQERIWYVNGNVAGPGTGTSSDPFNALPATAGDADDFIFVHTSTLGGSITLQNGQKLYGEAFGLSINQSLNGNPAPVVLAAPGTSPTINATTGNAVGVLANTASGNLANLEIRGLTLSTSFASSNAIDITSANAANVAVTISGVTVTGATAEGIDINQGSTGTATVSMSNVTVTSTGNGIDLDESAGALTVTSFSGITISGNTGASGIVVTNATFDATAGAPYNQVAGGTTAVGDAGNPVGGAGVVLTSVSGDLAFTDLDIFTANGAGLQITGTGAVNGAAGTGTLVSVAAAVATMQSTGGPVLDITNATVSLPLDTANVTSSPTTGISLVNVAGTSPAASVSATFGSILSTTGIAVNVSGGTVSLNYGGNITQNNNVAMVSVSGHTTGTITFSGGTLTATNGTGLQFDNADSTTSYNFTGTTMLNGGDAGIDILNGSAGTFTFGTGTTINNPSGTAFLLSGSNANVTYSGTISDNSGFAVDISGHAAGTVTFQTGTITSTGNGLQVSSNTGGSVNFNSPTIALTTGVNKAVTLDVGNAGGTINFAPAGGNGLDISTTTGTGFSALGGGTISVTGAGNTINAATGAALDVNAAIGAGGLNFATTTSGGGTRNVKLTSVTGGTIALGGGTLSGSTGAAFLVGDGAGGASTGGTSAITYGGSITSTAAARAVDIQDRAAGAGNISLSGTITHSSGNANVIVLDDNAAGTITFSGANSVANGGTSTAVSLTDNTGTTISFTGGGLDIDATSGGGFVATGGGTVTVTGTGNTSTTTTGLALNVANVTISASNVTFQSVSANGGANGIVLNTTGALGGLKITGDGGSTNNGSGGTIQNTSGHGVSLNNTSHVEFDQLNVTSTGGSGINGMLVTNFTYTNGTVSNSGNAVGESNIAFNGSGTLTGNNIAGTLTVTGSTLTNAFDSGLDVQSNDGTISHAIVTNNTITSSTSTATSKGTGINFVGTGNASTVHSLTRATITGNTVRNFPSNAGIQINYNSTNSIGPRSTAGIPGDPTNIILISGNTVRGESASNRFGTSAIILSQNGGNSSQRARMNFDVSNNGTVGSPMGDTLGTVILIGNNGYSDMTGTVSNNVMVANNTVGSPGIGGGNGIVVSSAETPDLTLTVTSNTISLTHGNGILLVGRGVSGLAKLGIRNNTVSAPTGGFSHGIRVDAGNASSGDDAICLDISGNTAAGGSGSGLTAAGIGLRKQGTNATVNDFGIEGMAATSSPGVENYVGGLNPGSADGIGDGSVNGVLLISAASGFSSCTSAP